MKKLLILLVAAIPLFTVRSVTASETSASAETQAAAALARRILPRLGAGIRFVHVPSDRDRFVLEMHGGELQITGNSAVSMAFGLNCYLREYCRVTVTWYRRDKIDEPKRLPVVEGRVEREARVENRFFLNYCTYGYSLNWWQWDEWEHFIDWMALNGVTMALATTGQEAVWQRVWRQFGLDDDTICRMFQPAFLPAGTAWPISTPGTGRCPSRGSTGSWNCSGALSPGNGSWASSRSSPLSRGMCPRR